MTLSTADVLVVPAELPTNEPGKRRRLRFVNWKVATGLSILGCFVVV
jgi:hypothetical protein